MSNLNNFIGSFTEDIKTKKREPQILKGTKAVVQVRVGDLHENPKQARASFSSKELEILANSIEREGLHHPIHIWRDEDSLKLYISSGHRRVTACKSLEGENYLIDAFIFNTEREAQEAAVSINEFAKSIHPLERANEIEALYEIGRFNSVEEMANYYGWHTGNAYKYQKLLVIPRELRGRLIDAGHNSLRDCLKVAKEIEVLKKEIEGEKGRIPVNQISEVILEYIPHLLNRTSTKSPSKNKEKATIKGILYLENGIGKFREGVFKKLDDDELSELETVYEILGRRIKEKRGN